jgi:hypothetical protein
MDIITPKFLQVARTLNEINARFQCLKSPVFQLYPGS